MGVRAAVAARKSSQLLTGLIDRMIVDEEILAEAGSVYGPLSLVNTACNDCANVEFKEVGSQSGHAILAATATRCIAGGQRVVRQLQTQRRINA